MCMDGSTASLEDGMGVFYWSWGFLLVMFISIRFMLMWVAFIPRVYTKE